MITARMKEGSEYAGQKIRLETSLFGKEYYWMEDVDGTTYLCPKDEDGNPRFN